MDTTPAVAPITRARSHATWPDAALFATPVVLVVAGIAAGWPGVVGAALGLVVVGANFLLLARLMATGAKAGPQATAFAAMLSYVVLIVVVTLLAIVVRAVSPDSLASFVLTVALVHLALLFLELPKLGLTPGAPGLKPRPLSETDAKKESR